MNPRLDCVIFQIQYYSQGNVIAPQTLFGESLSDSDKMFVNFSVRLIISKIRRGRRL